jgi:precorrin-6x reductase
MIDALTQKVLNLTNSEQDRLFSVLTENADILIRVLPNSTLLAHIINDKVTDNSPIIQAYSAWKKSH